MVELFKDTHNKISFSRVFSAILILSYLIGMFYLLVVKKEFIDIPLQMAGLIAGMYGINRFSGPKSINGGDNNY